MGSAVSSPIGGFGAKPPKDFGQSAAQMQENSVQFNFFRVRYISELSPLIPLLIT